MRCCDMIYTVEEASIKLNVSKRSVYNKIKLPIFKDKILMEQGRIYISQELLDLMQDSLKLKSQNIEDVPIDKPQEKEDLLASNNELFKLLMEQLKVKDIQIHEKDLQIHELNDRLSQEQDLHKNTQILFRQQQPQQNLLEMEDHFQALDNKLIEIKDRMQQRKEEQLQKEQEKNKSWLKKIFH